MAEKAAVFQTSQIGVQSAYGTAGTPNKKLGAIDLTIIPRNEAEEVRPLGMKYATGVSQNKEWSEVRIGGKPAFQDLVYILSGLLHYTAPTQQAATAAYSWPFVSNTTAADEGKYFTVIQGDSVNSWQVKDVKFASLSLSFARNGIGINGVGYGGAIDTTSSKVTPTVIQSVPITPAITKIKLADTQAGLAGAAAFCRSFSLNWDLTDKFSLAWPIGCDPFDVEGTPNYSAKITVATNADGMALVGKLRDGSTKWIRVEAEGPTIEGAYKHKLTMDFPVKISELGDMSEQEKLWVIQFGLQPIHDATWGKAMNIEIITSLASL